MLRCTCHAAVRGGHVAMQLLEVLLILSLHFLRTAERVVHGADHLFVLMDRIVLRQRRCR
jgi:hypothetical protein